MKRVVIIGAGGRLGAALTREYAKEFDMVGFNHAQLDLGQPEQLRERLGALEFDALINTAAQTNVDRCETHQEEAFAINAERRASWRKFAHKGRRGSSTSAPITFSMERSASPTRKRMRRGRPAFTANRSGKGNAARWRRTSGR